VPGSRLWLPARVPTELARRAAALAIALAIEFLLLLALLSLGRSAALPPKPQLTDISLSARDVAEAPAPAETSSRPVEQAVPQPVETAASVIEPAPAPAFVIPLPTAPRSPPPAERAPAAPRAVIREEAYGPPDTGAPSSDDSERVGIAPDGSPLYRAQWYREPGPEFRGFLSAASPGYGLIACRTIPNFYVTDCIALDESPGSMLTRSMLAGSGVLRVRPPRLGGRSLVGAWVRIRVDYMLQRK
jgi:protein TonB